MMAWVKLDDQFFRHPKVLAAGRDARDLYMVGLCYCAQGLTDGFIPSQAVRVLAAEAEIDTGPASAARLVDVGLWEPIDGGYAIHDYHEYQPSKERVLATREARAEAGSRGGKQKASNLLEQNASKTLANPKQKSAPYPSRTPSRTQEDPKPEEETPPLPPEPVAPPDGGGRVRDISDLPAVHASRFDAFWEAYPKKVGKKSCQVWWGKRRPSAELTQTILDSIEAHKHGDQWQRNFVKDPIRWLQEERWTDEIPTTPIPSMARSPAVQAIPTDGRPTGRTDGMISTEVLNWSRGRGPA
jgi:hypothetical protein